MAAHEGDPPSVPPFQGGKERASRFSRTRAQTGLAQKLRRKATWAERLLWSRLSRAQLGGFKFRRQHPIGSYVVDFYCPEVRLAVELDGDQHGTDGVAVKDARRTAILEARGVDVIRFWNHEAKDNLNGVADAILVRAQELKAEAAARRGDVPSPWKGEG